MNPLQIYRRRIIPSECILLKDDEIIRADDEVVITKWNTLHPKHDFSHGCSCYFLKQGIKVSKFYRADNSLLYWYCDIVDYAFDSAENTLIVTDLLADVIVYPNGSVKVMDLDELADALDRGLISASLMSLCLKRLNSLLTLIYRDKFDRLQSCLDNNSL